MSKYFNGNVEKPKSSLAKWGVIAGVIAFVAFTAGNIFGLSMLNGIPNEYAVIIEGEVNPYASQLTLAPIIIISSWGLWLIFGITGFALGCIAILNKTSPKLGLLAASLPGISIFVYGGISHLING